jgi:hypothetical protein
MPPGFNTQAVDGEEVSKARVYAAALDSAPCPACAALAGLEYALADTSAPLIPNPNCTHAQGCRCQWL